MKGFIGLHGDLFRVDIGGVEESEFWCCGWFQTLPASPAHEKLCCCKIHTYLFKLPGNYKCGNVLFRRVTRRWDGHIYIYAFSRRFYPKRLTIAFRFRLYIFISTCVPWESNQQPFAQLTQCSTTKPHRNTVYIFFSKMYTGHINKLKQINQCTEIYFTIKEQSCISVQKWADIQQGHYWKATFMLYLWPSPSCWVILMLKHNLHFMHWLKLFYKDCTFRESFSK